MSERTNSVEKVLVTGAGGYIGSVLTRMLLDAGYQVVALDRFFFGRQTLPEAESQLHIVQDDIRWLKSSILQGLDAVIDLAALSNDPAGELEPEKTWEINHQGRARLARLAKAAKIQRYILPSSCSIYGFQESLLDETSPTNPLTTYARANLSAEQAVLPLADNDFCVVVIRQATVYGLSPRMRFDLAINGMVKGLVKNGKLPILRDGTQWRPFVHVRDTSRAMIALLQAPLSLVNGQIFNVGSDEQNCQIMSLAQTVSEAIGMPFHYEWYGLPDHRSYRVSFKKIENILSYKTLFTPSDGAREVYEALRQGVLNPDDPKTMTVEWYKRLIEMHHVIKQVEMKGKVL